MDNRIFQLLRDTKVGDDVDMDLEKADYEEEEKQTTLFSECSFVYEGSAEEV